MARFMYRQELNVPELMFKGGRTYRLIKDQLGSVRLVVDTGDGTIVQEMRYDAWGNVVLDTNPGFQPFGFAGGLYDPQTRLVRFGARDYDASIGRWMGKDPLPLWAAGPNSFWYANGAPTTATDPSGLIVTPWQVDCARNWAQLALVLSRRKAEHSEFSRNQADAWRHCNWSCWMAKYCGRFAAWLLASGYELGTVPDRGGWDPNDFFNNAQGRDCARLSCDCRTCCQGKLRCGALQVPGSSSGGYYGPPPTDGGRYY